MRGNALLGYPVHFRCANLDFKRLASCDDGSMQRLVHVWSRHRDEIFDAARNGTPGVVDDAQGGVAVPYIIRDDSQSKQIVNLIDRNSLLFQLQVNRI